MNFVVRTSLAVALIGLCAGVATAQVRYQPYPYPAPQPAPYGYPVSGGVLQPDETLGTSPSFVIAPYPYPGQPAVQVVRRCQYPDGWNVTDFNRDISGIPAGVGHTCPDAGGVRARY